MHWIRPDAIGGVDQEIKIDLLVGPIDDRRRSKLKITAPRVQPKDPGLEFHAHAVPEAVRLEKKPSRSRSPANAQTATPTRPPSKFPRPFPT